jgi:hypothetical protein
MAKPRGGKRFPLVMYRYMLDRWWHATLATGIMILINAGTLAVLPMLPDIPSLWVDDFTLILFAGIGGIAIAFTLFLIIIRKSAYVQLFPDHLCVVTFFLRLKISYKRIRKTTTADFGAFLPASTVTKEQAQHVAPFARFTAIRLDFAADPLPRWQMKFFLSPLFFAADKTPHMLLLVSDWMGLSTEIESMRAGVKSPRRTNYYNAPVQTPPRPAAATPGRPKRPTRPSTRPADESSILSGLKDDRER